MWNLGFAREDITAFEPGMAMLGWGMPDNQAHGVAEPLYARAAVVVKGDVRVAIVVVDLMMVSDAVRIEVIDRLQRDHAELGFDAVNVVLSATHTHSGPSGFAHYMWLNLAAPGYSEVVFEAVVSGIVAAILAASSSLRPGNLRLASTVIPTSEEIAFNRAIASYNRNPEVTEPVAFEDRAEATDRVMTQLTGVTEDGEVIGILNWFGVHGTCVHAENRKLHPDHKGLAAQLLDADGAISVLCQEACGDVSPNFRYDPVRRKTIGKFDDDYASAAHVGEVQARYARTLRDDPASVSLSGDLAVATLHVDFAAAPVDARFAPAHAAATTGPASLGVSMARGTAEGPGPLLTHGWVPTTLNGAVRGIDRLRAFASGKRSHDPKWPLLDLAAGLSGRLLGTIPIRSLRYANVDPVVGYVKSLVDRDALGDAPWISQIIPLQLVVFGSFAVAAVPFEMTTVAARRLRATLLEELASIGVETVVLQTYANAYVGYVTTHEEYEIQGYEGGYTLFGPWSLAALRTAFARLASNLIAGRQPPLQPQLYRFDKEQVQRRSFTEPWPPSGLSAP